MDPASARSNESYPRMFDGVPLPEGCASALNKLLGNLHDRRRALAEDDTDPESCAAHMQVLVDGMEEDAYLRSLEFGYNFREGHRTPLHIEESGRGQQYINFAEDLTASLEHVQRTREEQDEEKRNLRIKQRKIWEQAVDENPYLVLPHNFDADRSGELTREGPPPREYPDARDRVQAALKELLGPLYEEPTFDITDRHDDQAMGCFLKDQVSRTASDDARSDCVRFLDAIEQSRMDGSLHPERHCPSPAIKQLPPPSVSLSGASRTVNIAPPTSSETGSSSSLIAIDDMDQVHGDDLPDKPHRASFPQAEHGLEVRTQADAMLADLLKKENSQAKYLSDPVAYFTRKIEVLRELNNILDSQISIVDTNPDRGGQRDGPLGSPGLVPSGERGVDKREDGSAPLSMQGLPQSRNQDEDIEQAAPNKKRKRVEDVGEAAEECHGEHPSKYQRQDDTTAPSQPLTLSSSSWQRTQREKPRVQQSIPTLADADTAKTAPAVVPSLASEVLHPTLGSCDCWYGEWLALCRQDNIGTSDQIDHTSFCGSRRAGQRLHQC